MPLASVYNQNLITVLILSAEQCGHLLFELCGDRVVFRVNQRRKAYVAEIMESGERHENTDVCAK